MLLFCAKAESPKSGVQLVTSAGHSSSVIPCNWLVINRQLKTTVGIFEGFSNALPLYCGRNNCGQTHSVHVFNNCLKPTLKTNVKQTRQNRSG